MDHDAGVCVALSVTVATDMSPAVNDGNLMPGLRQMATDNGA
jgi:DNA-binding IclR family transcriptional regulator